ncbi:oligosaccharide flippase family protein [Thalassotalea sp. 1_MG-2023]|uniref:oligosaccharide flippase family protein n=1 Tax=Thalassotalea sp. 1_MG-2023 TaxID=3062680 RepID=UPI0026E1A32E|nr:oligosaccharide flippase family protein [Thalassotalea sp. 1_MG-2023]MDO6425535.1 oligosaccharide flippase family protein [Thalassotalea sp. 1_MG-2023]
MSQDSKERKLGVLLGYLSVAFRNIASLLLIPFIISQIGVSHYGLYGLITAITGYLVIIEFGLANTTIRFISKYRVAKDKSAEQRVVGNILWLYMIIVLIVLGAGFFIWHAIPFWFVEALTTREIALFQTLLVISLLNIVVTLISNSFTGIISAYEKFVFLKSLEVVTFLLRVCLVLFLLSLGFGVIAIVVIDTVANLIASACKVGFVIRVMKIKVIIEKPSKESLYVIGSYTFFIALNVIINQVNWRADSFILGIFTDSHTLGVYNVGSQFVLAFIAVASTMTSIFMPQFMRLVNQQKSMHLITNHLIIIGRYQFIVLGLAFICFMSFGQLFVELFVGKGFENAYWITLISLVPLIFVLSQSSSNAILQAMNKHKVRSILLLSTAILNIMLSVFLVQKIGMIGAAIGTAITLIIGEVILVNIYLIWSVKLDMVRFYKTIFIRVIPVIVISLLITMVVRDYIPATWLGLILGCSFSAFIYMILAVVISLTVEERGQLVAYIKVKKSG